MPSVNFPLSYDASKAVLQHMDPNLRALLVSKCPTLKARDSNVPQRIESISVGPARISINEKTYQLGVVSQWPQGEVPAKLRDTNENGGVHWDMDKYGFRTPTPDVTPGDFPLAFIRQPTEEDIRNKCKQQIWNLKQRLNARKQKKKSMEAIALMRRERGVVERSRRTDILEEMDDSITEAEAFISLYQRRLDNNEKDIPYTFYLQLTISTNGPDGKTVQHIERMQYTGNLGPATKYLFERLLKKPMNYVKELKIAPLTVKDCFWLPAEMNLTARHLIMENHDGVVWRTVGQFFRRINQRSFETIAFKLRTCPDYVQFVPLIDYWVIHGAPIGRHYTAYTSTTEGSNWHNSMKGREGHIIVETPTRRCRCFLDCVILPLPNNAQLEFYITPVVDRPFTVLLNFEVQPRI